jgi:hypothetical protein
VKYRMDLWLSIRNFSTACSSLRLTTPEYMHRWGRLIGERQMLW